MLKVSQALFFVICFPTLVPAKAAMVLFVDADDTLWHDSKYFRALEREFSICAVKSGHTREHALHILRQTLKSGPCKGEARFIISLRKAARNLDFGSHLTRRLQAKIDLFNRRQIQLLPGVQKALARLAGIPKVLITKGRQSEQIRKLLLSGLKVHFCSTMIVPSKTTAQFRSVLRFFGLNGSQVVSIGNSVLHDVLPALKNSAKAIWINHADNNHGRNADLPKDAVEVKSWNEIPPLIHGFIRERSHATNESVFRAVSMKGIMKCQTVPQHGKLTST